MQFWGVGFAGTVGFATGAPGGGEAAGQQRALAGDHDFPGWSGLRRFFHFVLDLDVYIIRISTMTAPVNPESEPRK
jgi:hypothetical protein